MVHKYITLIVLLLLSNFSFSQAKAKPSFIRTDHSNQIWYKEIRKDLPNYKLVEEEFNNYFAVHPLEKSIQKNIVRRWLMTASCMQDAKGIVLPFVQDNVFIHESKF